MGAKPYEPVKEGTMKDKILRNLIGNSDNIDEIVNFLRYESEHFGVTDIFTDIDKICVKRNNPILSYNLAKRVKGVDFEAHQDVVINSHNAILMNSFANCVKGADKAKISKAISEHCSVFEQIVTEIH